MTWLDAILIVLLIASVLGGLKMGLIAGLIPFAGLVTGIYLGVRFDEPVGRWLSFLPFTAARWVAFTVIFVLTLAAAGGLAKLLSRVASTALPGWVDHVLGAVWGMVAGIFFLGALMTVGQNGFGDAGFIQDSRLAGFLTGAFETALTWLPAEFDAVMEFFQSGPAART